MFSPGRVVISLALIPATIKLASDFSRQRHRVVATDLFMIATSVWMFVSVVFQSNGTSASSLVVSAGSEVLEFFGAYLLARAYFNSRLALIQFIRVFKIVTLILIAFAVLDVLSGRYLVYETTAQIFGVPVHPAMDRSGFFRAQSTLDHPILYGAFCTIAGTLFLYSEANPLRQILYGGICFFGVLLSVSSGPILAFGVMIGCFCYDRIMKMYRWRWKLLLAALGGLLCSAFFVSNSPVGWLITHLTFDPENGYFRLATWYAAFDQIASSPMFGLFREKTGNEFLDLSVDCVWLVSAIQYGLPMGVFLFLANVSSFLPPGSKAKIAPDDDPYLKRMRTGLTMALSMFMFIGLTVDYWNSMWMFWGLCIGIRASLWERYILSTKREVRAVRRISSFAK
jgi:hypothetical protein